MFDLEKLTTDTHKVAAWVALQTQIEKIEKILTKAEELKAALTAEQSDIRRAVSFIAASYTVRYVIASKIYTVGKGSITQANPVSVDLSILHGSFDDGGKAETATAELEQALTQVSRAMDLDGLE